jgi:hypothetical protein
MADCGDVRDLNRAEAMDGCELGIRCPLFFKFMALHRSALHHRAAATGRGKEFGRSYVGLQQSLWHIRDAQSKAAQDHPLL